MADITVEIDKERVFREVVDRLVQGLYNDCKTQVQQIVMGQFTVEIKLLAKKHFRTFRQYLEDLMLKPNKTSYSNRPRLAELLDTYVINHASALFHDVVSPHLIEVKKRLAEAVTGAINRG